MKKTLAFLIAVLLSALLTGQTNYFKKEPYLFFKNKVNPITGEVTPEIDKVVIQWQLNVFMNDPCKLVYGLEPNNGPIVTATYLPDDLWYVELDFDEDLEYDEYYYYLALVMNDGIPIGGKQGSFRTPPLNNASSIIFYGYGDTRTYPAVHDQVCSSIINSLDGTGQDQTLLIHTGDWTSNDEENDWQTEYFNTAFPNSLEVKSKFQIMGALGNHEHYGTTFKKYWPYSYYDLSNLGFHYSFDYGPIHFCIVELAGTNSTLTQAQKNWIENDLDASSADWKVMVFHAPGYSSGHHPNNEEAQDYLHPLCSAKGVQLVLNGHNHYYAHWYLDRVHHLTLGGGGAFLYDPTNTSGPGHVYSQKVHHFAKFTINGDIMKVNVIDKEGDEVESFAIPKTFTICNNTNALWNEDIILADNVIVCSGSTLTITSKVSFIEYAKIIVQPGGWLILDGALLTSSGNYFWQGIEVRGNPNSPSPLHQGRLSMKNGAVIENAIVAVRNHRYNEDVTPKYSEQGGRIGATNSTFRNNIKAVDARDYPYTSMVSFKDCDFIYDEDYFGTGDPGYFMEIRSMKGLNVTSCNFINNTGVDYKGSGIYSYRSQVNIKGKCITPAQPSCLEWEYGTFENLEYGVYATGIPGGQYIDIRNTTFDLCHRGLYISGMTNARITSNRFNTNAHYKPLPLGGYGMYLNNSTGYWVEDNDYYHEGPTQVGIGIIVHNSGAVPNKIYNNRFTNLTMGVSAQENNGNILSVGGLQILCNDFIDCAADILVPRPSIAGWGIAGNQGANSQNPAHMAGNLFHIPSPVPDGDFDDINNQGRHVNYYYPLNTIDDDVKPVDYTQNTVLPIEINNSPIWTPETGCPSGIDTGGGGEDMRILMAESQQKIDSTQSLLAMLIDGGNTWSLQTDVAHSFPPEAMAIYTALIDKSPYLSDTVVSTAIGKENVLVDAMIRDVMVANPHTAKNEELLNKLDERWTPLPEYMIDQILQGRNLVSVKEKTESQLARFMLDKTRAMSRLERAYRSDTVNIQASLDSLAMLYAADHSPESKYRLAFLQLERGEALQGQSTMNAMPGQFAFGPDQAAEHDMMVEFYNLLASFAGSAPDSAAVQALLAMAQHEHYHAAMYAVNTLIDLGEVQYEEPVIMPDYLKSARASGSQPGVDKTRKPQMLKVKPNPAKDFIIVEYEIETGGNILIEVTDMSGKPVHSMQAINARDEVTVDTRHWKPGAYIVTLKLNGKPVESVKFTKTQ